MKIKKIKKLQADWYEVTLEREGKTETFKLTDDLLVEYRLVGSQTLDDLQYEQLKQLADYARCFNQALNYLTHRMRTEQEIRDYLNKKGCPPDDREAIISKLKRLKYIDDEQFAMLYAKEQFKNNRGPLWITDQLLKKGVNKALAERTIAQISPEAFNRQMVEYMAKLDRMYRMKPIPKRKQSILRTLLNRGYEFEAIRDAFESFSFTPLEDEHELARNEAEKAYRKWKHKYEGYELKERLVARLTYKGYSYPVIKEVLDQLFSEESVTS